MKRKPPANLTLPAVQRLLLLGWQVAVVERREQRNGRVWKVDLWHFADLLACYPIDHSGFDETHGGFLFVQVTDKAHMQARLEKMRDPKIRSKVRGVLLAGGRIEIQGWHQGSVEILEVTLDLLDRRED